MFQWPVLMTIHSRCKHALPDHTCVGWCTHIPAANSPHLPHSLEKGLDRQEPQPHLKGYIPPFPTLRPLNKPATNDWYKSLPPYSYYKTPHGFRLNLVPSLDHTMLRLFSCLRLLTLSRVHSWSKSHVPQIPSRALLLVNIT